MNNENENKLEKLSKGNPFKVPSGYFENLSDAIMAQLPERQENAPTVISLWERVKPWTYMAAMFIGIALMIKLFIGSPDKPSDILSDGDNAQIHEIDEFYTYYQDEFAISAYRETLFLEEEYPSDIQSPSDESDNQSLKN